MDRQSFKRDKNKNSGTSGAGKPRGRDAQGAQKGAQSGPGRDNRPYSGPKDTRKGEPGRDNRPYGAPRPARPLNAEQDTRPQADAYSEAYDGEDSGPRSVGERDDLVFGRNSALELLKSGREVENLYIAKGEQKGSIVQIISLAKQRRVPIKEVSPAKLDAMCGGQVHQGVAAVLAAARYVEVEDILERARQADEPVFLVLLDGVTDPHNLGAIIRSAEGAGAHGVIIPRRGAVGLTATVAKTSAGAVEHLPVARVPNLAQLIDQLKKQGVWVAGADTGGESWHSLDYRGPLAVVIGAEGRGLGRLLRERCDFIASLPMRGKVESLNASVAAGIILYEAMRQRTGVVTG